MHRLAKLDHQYVWHPFTQMRDWLASEPILITEGQGVLLRDTHGREYLDANSSIWTNLHGHNHPRINRAIHKQLGKIAHSSFLGLANEPSALLEEKLINLAHTRRAKGKPLRKAFFSDDGSTAMEVALKVAFQFKQRTRGIRRPRFLSLDRAYHGDTVGAASVGHIDLFHKAYSPLLFKTDKVRAPYCYRCPHNRAQPERAEAREYRKCNWECLDKLERKLAGAKNGQPYDIFVFEPLMQGAAGMIAQPEGWLGKAAQLARNHGALLVADEVMTGFGRAGVPSGPVIAHVPILACQKERVLPDLAALAKGMSGGYLPMAATLATQEIFDAFLGKYEEFKTFFHGHSYSGNQLGAAASLASLEILTEKESARARAELEKLLRTELKSLWTLPQVGDIRQVGLMAGIELVRNWKTREPFRPAERVGARVCEAMAKMGVLTRPIGDVIVIMPPYCTNRKQLSTIFDALRRAIDGLVLG